MEKSSFKHTLQVHSLRYPAWQVQDIYKLSHQAALGCEHAVVDHSHASTWLDEELSHLSGQMIDPLIDPISADGEIVRVHLRPFSLRNLPTEKLLDAFLQTALMYKGSTDTLHKHLEQAVELAQHNCLPVDPASLMDFFALMREKGFPAVHHSEAFEEAYHPAYRVVARKYLQGVPCS